MSKNKRKVKEHAEEVDLTKVCEDTKKFLEDVDSDLSDADDNRKKIKMDDGDAKRYWLLTFNKINQEKWKSDFKVMVRHLRWLESEELIDCATTQVERGAKTGHYHIHVAVLLASPGIKFSEMREMFKDWRPNIVHRPCWSDCKNYATKPKSRVLGPIQIGTPTVYQGKREDLHKAMKYVEKGGELSDLYEQDANLIVYRRVLKEAADDNKSATVRNAGWRGQQIYILFGPPGTGKTRHAIEEGAVKWFWKQPWFIPDDIIVLDDWDGSCLAGEQKAGAILSYFNGIFDGNPQRLPSKGGHVWCNPSIIWITTNIHPTQWECWMHAPTLVRQVSFCFHEPFPNPYKL
jgi:hypothetical protein